MSVDKSTFNTPYSEVNLIEYIIRLLSYWWIFLLSLIICLGLSYFYIKSTPEVYSISSRILLNLNDNNSISQESKYIDGGVGYSQGEINMFNEQGIIKSKSLIETAAQKMNLEIGYFKKLLFGKIDLYPCAPIHVSIVDSSSILYNTPIEFIPINNDSFQIKIKVKDFFVGKHSSEDKQRIRENLLWEQTYVYGQEIEHPYFSFKIIRDTDCPTKFQKETLESLFFTFNTVGNSANDLAQSLTVEMPDIQGSIMQLNIETENVSKGKEFLNNLVNIYIANRSSDQYSALSEQEKVLKARFEDITNQLNTSQENLKEFRRKSKTLNLANTSTTVLSQTSVLDTDKANLSLELRQYKGILVEVDRFQKDNDVFSPSTAGINDDILKEEILELKRYSAQRKRAAQYKGPSSLEIQNLNDQIINLTESIRSLVQNAITVGNTKMNSINSRLGKLNNAIKELPNHEQQQLTLERDFNLDDNLYKYLDQELSKINITKSTILNNVKVLDKARLDSEDPIAPQKFLILTFGGTLGLLFPLLIISFLGKRNSENNSKGNIPNKSLGNNSKDHNSSQQHLKNDNIENTSTWNQQLERASFETVLNIIIEEKNQLIAITSGLDGEGKTKTTYNLGKTLSEKGYKTIVVDLDFYLCGLSDLLQCSDKSNLNTYLTTELLDADQIIHVDKNDRNLRHICSIPSSKDGLIHVQNSKLEVLLSALRFEFDFVLIDTSSISQRFDNYILFQHIDKAIWVTKYHLTSDTSLKRFNEMNDLLSSEIMILNNDDL